MDPVADMLIAIKNAYMARKPELSVPLSKYKFEIAKILEKEKFVSSVDKKDKFMTVKLLYKDKKPKLTHVEKISKLGLRVYTKSKNIKIPRGGSGLTIVSTPKGVMSAREAIAKNLGGEVICQIW